MTLVVVERDFDDATTVDRLQALEDAVAWCLEQHRVRPLGSYLAADHRRMVCLYEAPDAEAVRRTQQQGKLPLTRVWAGQSFFAEPFRHSSELETVVVQRQHDVAVAPEVLESMRAIGEECLGRYRAHLDTTLLSACGTRQVCIYSAPDAEAVRVAHRQLPVPMERAWKASVHLAPSAD